MQVGFKKTLTKEVAAFAQDAKAFRGDWQANGPMVPGLAPLEAVERLKKFQQMFDVRPSNKSLSDNASTQAAVSMQRCAVLYYNEQVSQRSWVHGAPPSPLEAVERLKIFQQMFDARAVCC